VTAYRLLRDKGGSSSGVTESGDGLSVLSVLIITYSLIYGVLMMNNTYSVVLY